MINKEKEGREGGRGGEERRVGRREMERTNHRLIDPKEKGGREEG